MQTRDSGNLTRARVGPAAVLIAHAHFASTCRTVLHTAIPFTRPSLLSRQSFLPFVTRFFLLPVSRSTRPPARHTLAAPPYSLPPFNKHSMHRAFTTPAPNSRFPTTAAAFEHLTTKEEAREPELPTPNDRPLAGHETRPSGSSSPLRAALTSSVFASQYAAQIYSSGTREDPLIPKRRRRTTPAELAILENEFRLKPRPDPIERAHLAERLGMTVRAVQVWYQNRR